MADHTLVDSEIRDKLNGGSILMPWTEDSIHGASYDIRVGRSVYRAAANGSSRYQVRDISKEGSLTLESGNIVIVEGLERVELPQNMKG